MRKPPQVEYCALATRSASETFREASTRQSRSAGGWRNRLMSPRRVLSVKRAWRFERLGRVGLLGGGAGASARATSSVKRSTAISWLRLSDRSSCTVIRTGRAARSSTSASLAATCGSRPTRLSALSVSSARVEALSRCWPPGPLERLAVHCAAFKRCSTTSLLSNDPLDWRETGQVVSASAVSTSSGCGKPGGVGTSQR
jgi:hypothetical protein